MAGVFHISEAEAARDFNALLRRVRAGEEVVVDCEGGVAAVMKMVAPAEPVKARSIAAILEGLRRREEAQGLATPDEEFARDIAEAREFYNVPLDSSAWD